jgi:hypothetical protein
MYESEEDVRRLREMLDRTLARANPHLASIVSPKRRITARQDVTMLVEPSSMWAYAFHPEEFPE